MPEDSSILAMHPEHADESQLSLANDLLTCGSPRQAISAFRRLLQSSRRLEAGLGIAAALQQAGKHWFSHRVLNILADEFPGDHRPPLLLASQALEAEDFLTAWRYLQSCLHSKPDCIEAWLKAYTCASRLERHELCELIARKLLELDSDSAKHYELLAVSLAEQNRALEACEAYEEARKRTPADIFYFINSRLPFCRISPSGLTPSTIAAKIKATAKAIQKWKEPGKKWEISSDRGLTNAIFYVAYTPFNLKELYEPYLSALGELVSPLITAAITESHEMAAHLNFTSQPTQHEREQTHDHPQSLIRLGIASRHFYSHSNAQAFEGFLKYIDRSNFRIILIHLHGTVADPVHVRLNEWADEVVYLSESLPHTHLVLSSLDLDILFFTDIGMSPLDFMVPALRSCDLQITGWGLPHTTGLKTIDYYLSSNLLETQEHANEYTEELVLLPGLPCCFLSTSLHYQKRPKQYFMLPDDRLIIGCVQTLFKIHPDMDLIVERIAKRLPDVVFAFVTFSDPLDSAFLARLMKRAPTAFQRTILLSRCSNTDFLALCDCLDIILDTPYYGAGITAYMSTYVGTPMVCFSGRRLRDSTTAAIYRYLSINDAPIVNSIPEYVDKVVELANDFDRRFQIKKDTVEAAHKLYDNQEYIRGFEKFCLALIADKELRGKRQADSQLNSPESQSE